MLVKFVHGTYGEVVHASWAAAGLAPALHNVTSLPGGMKQVVMEELPAAEWTCAALMTATDLSATRHAAATRVCALHLRVRTRCLWAPVPTRRVARMATAAQETCSYVLIGEPPTLTRVCDLSTLTGPALKVWRTTQLSCTSCCHGRMARHPKDAAAGSRRAVLGKDHAISVNNEVRTCPPSSPVAQCQRFIRRNCEFRSATSIAAVHGRVYLSRVPASSAVVGALCAAQCRCPVPA